MSRTSANWRVDSNHAEVVQALKAAGWKVLSLAGTGGGCPDLLLHHPVRGWRLVEVKTKAGKLRPKQAAFMAHGWPVTVVRTVDEALSL